MKTGKNNKHIHKVPRRCDLTSSSLMSHYPDQVRKRKFKFGDVKKQLLLFQATTYQKRDILAAEAFGNQ